MFQVIQAMADNEQNAATLKQLSKQNEFWASCIIITENLSSCRSERAKVVDIPGGLYLVGKAFS